MKENYDEKNFREKKSTILKNIKDILLEGNEHEDGCIYAKLLLYFLFLYFIGLFFYNIIFT